MTSKTRADVPSWEGDWRARITERVRSKGFDDLSAFLEANAGLSYGELAHELAPDEDLAPVQLERVHAEIGQTDEVGKRRAAQDSLTRFLRGALKSGWDSGRYWESRVTGALASWTVTWGGSEELRRVKDALFALHPPVAWIPESGDDPILSKAFDIGWPEESR